MKIGVNGFFLRHLGTGIGQYLSHILPRMIEHSTHQWVIYVPYTESLDISELQAYIHYVSPWRKGDNLGHRVVWEWVQMSWLIRKDHLDVLWSPSPSMTSIPESMRSVVSVHDVIPWRFPEYQGSRKERWYTKQIESALKRRDHEIITVSEFSKREVQNIFGLQDQAITVTHLAPAKQPPNSIKPSSSSEMQCIYVGGMDKRKNLDRLLQALKYLQDEYQISLSLLITGKYREHPLNPPIPELIEQYGVTDSVTMTGFLSEEDLIQSIAQADILVYPSLYEGFGLPILEGMALDTPVITSDRGAMREVAGEAAFLIDPESVSDIAKALYTLATDTSLRQYYQQQGQQRVQEFSWDKCARETLAVLQRTQDKND